MKSSKTTRRALLGSLTSLVLCFAMLIGSTFAWFTDTASTSVNTIQAGTLDVALEMKNAQGQWVPAEGETLDFVKASGHESETILWEPGCTYSLPELRIVNSANLALKYKVAITAAQGEQNNKLAEVLDVTVKVGDTALPSVGTLKDVLAQNMDTYIVNNVLEAGQDSGAIAISMKMKESAGNDYQGLSVGKIAITVYATQATVEHDSNNDQYDKDADFPMVWDGTTTVTPDAPNTWANNELHISTAAELVGAMNVTNTGATNSWAYGKTIVLDKDIDLGGATIKGFGSLDDNISFTFDGQNHTISNFKIESTSRYAGLFNQVSHGGVIKNLTVADATIKGTSAVGAVASSVEGDGTTLENCKAINCIVVGNQQVGSVTGYVATGAIVTGCRAEKCFVGYAANPEYQDSECQIVGYHNASSQGTVENNTYSDVTIVEGTVTLVSTAAELADAISNGGTIVLTKDIDMNNNWTTASVSNKGLTICGNGHTITKLNKPLVNFYGGTCTINDLTVKDSTVAANGDDTKSVLGAGIILEEAQWANLYMTNCHVKNSSVNVGGSNSRAGALVGYWIGGGEIKNCSVNSCTVYGAESAGGIVGHRQGQSAQGYEATAKVTGCTVSNTSVNSGRFAGAVLGRLSTEAFEINNCTYTGNAYGNIWDGGNGTVKIDGTTHNANG